MIVHKLGLEGDGFKVIRKSKNVSVLVLGCSRQELVTRFDCTSHLLSIFGAWT